MIPIFGLWCWKKVGQDSFAYEQLGLQAVCQNDCSTDIYTSTITNHNQIDLIDMVKKHHELLDNIGSENALSL